MSVHRILVDRVTVYSGDNRSSGRDDREGSGKRLDSISCELEPGKLTLLLGTVGSGKSTLLDVLGGLVTPDEGTVKHVPDVGGAGKVESDDPRHAGLVGADIGMMFQFPEQQLFARTVQGEFDYSLRPLKLPPAQAAAQTATALREVGLPGGTLALHPFALSGGEQRRVAMATTLATAPGWLLLDEASAGLDAEGTRRFAQQLRRWTREERLGVVLATHDLETFLPLADEVLILVRGRLAAAMRREQLVAAPAVLAQAGLALPERVRAAAWLRARGLAGASAGGAEAGYAMAPAGVADAVARALAARERSAAAAPAGRSRREAADGPASSAPARATPTAPAPDSVKPAAPTPASTGGTVAPEPSHARAAAELSPAYGTFAPEPTLAREAPELSPAPATVVPAPTLAREAPELSPALATAAPERTPAPPAARVDPRAAWLYTTLVSIGMLLQTSRLGLAVSAAVTGWTVARSTVSFRTVSKLLLPFAGLMSFTVAFAGLHWDGYSIAEAVETLKSMLRFLFMMAVGVLLPLEYSPLTLKQALERSLSGLARWKLPIEPIALYVAMLTRFIPLIRSEWGRFARIARARGRRRSKPGTIRLWELPATAIPMLLSLFRLADSAATAMEMRGYPAPRLESPASPYSRQRFALADYIRVLVGIAAFLLLALIRIME
ncbi:ATP-binding cassette domain-containing protein [Paenibacillus sp. HJGM_3]|uniref:ATP-binding cassette domain-containing protein n=1 Tax=Paenibacillus sp. HJGM_3 TaxID=3379816 RepID=UPI003858605C